MERVVSAEEGKRLAEQWKAAFLETSAKQNEVRYLFIIIFCQHKIITFYKYLFLNAIFLN